MEKSEEQNEEIKADQEKEDQLQARQKISDTDGEAERKRQREERTQEETGPLASSSGLESTRESQLLVPPEALNKANSTDGSTEHLEEGTPFAATQSKTNGTTDPQSKTASATAGEAAATHDADEKNATGHSYAEFFETASTEDHQHPEHLEDVKKEFAKAKNAVGTNATATPGDSDSSTAVSHTTSPLLL
ncbi:mucin-associated surface protein (MASP), putative, partial [Trypanosoma cruzi marinkellei]